MEVPAIRELNLRSGGSASFRRLLAAGFAVMALFALATPADAIVKKRFISPVTTEPAPGTKVNVDATRITYDPNSTVATADGNVVMVYGPYTLTATKVKYNQSTGVFDANGSVVLKEPNGNVLFADSAEIRNKFKQGFARHVKALLTNDVTITADFVRRVNGDITIFEKATYTACKDCKTRSGHPLWEIDSDQTTHDIKSHNLYHVHPRFKLNGATIVSLPYFNMPDPAVTRRSGFLTPDLKTGPDYGIGVVVPYFWALSPSTDLTFRPVLTTRQGPIADIEYRQAFENGTMNARGIGVHQFTDLPYPEDRQWRGAITSHGRFFSGTDWTYGWDGTLNTDRTFLNSYNYDDRVIATNDVYATGVWDQTYLNAQVFNFGSLSTGVDPNSLPYAMPFVSGDVVTQDPTFGGQFDFSWNAYSLHRAAPVSPFTTVNQGTDQTRATTQANWHKQFYGDMGTVITPFANLRSDVFVTENVPDPTAASGFTSTVLTRVLPEAGVDARLPFVAHLPVGQSIISPVFQLVTSANEGSTTGIGNEDAITLNYDHTSLFLADRFSGLDRYEGGTHADFGLTYSLIGNNGGFIRASAGQSVHLAGQNSFVDGSGLADNESDLVGAIVFRPWDVLGFSYEARLKDDLSAFNRQEASASLSFDRLSANVSYLNFAPQPAYGLPTQQHWASADARYNFGNGWNVFGGLSYDFINRTVSQRTLGVEFDCDCMNFRLAYVGTEDSATHQLSTKVLMSVEFATIGKTGFAANF